MLYLRSRPSSPTRINNGTGEIDGGILIDAAGLDTLEVNYPSKALTMLTHSTSSGSRQTGDCTSTTRYPDRLLCGASMREPMIPRGLHPVEQIRALVSNRPWHPTIIRRGRARVPQAVLRR
jgi:hypothetical protein